LKVGVEITYGKTNWALGNVSFVVFFIGPKIETYIQEKESIMATTTKFPHTNLANS
jgi:hypothetical protein